MTTAAGTATVGRSARSAWLLLGVVALAWGINWPVGKAMLAYLPPIWVVALRSAVGTFALLVICLLRGRLVIPKQIGRASCRERV